MKIKEGFKMRSILDAHMVVPEGFGLEGYNKMIVLNSTAAFLWECIEGKEFDVASLAASLVEEYEIDEQTATADASKLVDEWRNAGILDE